MLQGVGVGMQLATVEGDLLLFGGRCLEVHHAKGTIVKANQGVNLAPQEAGEVMTGQADGKRLDPFLGNGDHTRWQGRVKVGGGVAGELGFHQAVDGTKNGGEWGGRPGDAVEIFEVETARALIPQESQIGRAELDRGIKHGLSRFFIIINLYY